ncbi:MAG: TetR family transcriptional regulator [marine bacterium B5-7]|nr:MAG: TetR family transcriptional regulator [marine bacterium B5-7]
MARLREFDYDETLINAGRQFWASGYQATSILDIASVTGVKPGSLYKAFGDKKGLFLKCVKHYMEHTSYYAILVENPEASFKKSLRKILNLMVDSCDDTVRKGGCLVTNAAFEMASVDEEILGEMNKHLSQMKQAVLSHILSAQASGEIDKKKDADALAAYFITLIQGLLVSSRVTKDKTEMRDAINTGLSLLD